MWIYRMENSTKRSLYTTIRILNKDKIKILFYSLFSLVLIDLIISFIIISEYPVVRPFYDHCAHISLLKADISTLLSFPIWYIILKPISVFKNYFIIYAIIYTIIFLLIVYLFSKLVKERYLSFVLFSYFFYVPIYTTGRINDLFCVLFLLLSIYFYFRDKLKLSLLFYSLSLLYLPNLGLNLIIGYFLYKDKLREVLRNFYLFIPIVFYDVIQVFNVLSINPESLYISRLSFVLNFNNLQSFIISFIFFLSYLLYSITYRKFDLYFTLLAFPIISYFFSIFNLNISSYVPILNKAFPFSYNIYILILLPLILRLDLKKFYAILVILSFILYAGKFYVGNFLNFNKIFVNLELKEKIIKEIECKCIENVEDLKEKYKISSSCCIVGLLDIKCGFIQIPVSELNYRCLYIPK